MKSFKLFREGLNSPFATTKDRDNPSDSKYVCVYRSQDSYKLGGKTHGISSHAIKHLIEFNKSFVGGLIKQCISILKNEPQIFVKIVGKTKIHAEGKTTKRYITQDTVLNTLDYVNDKIKGKRKLLGWEQRLFPFIEKMTESYGNIIDRHIKKAVDIRDSNPNDVIVKFDVDSKGSNQTYVLDRSNDGLVIIDGAVRTMFTVNNLKHKLDRVKIDQEVLDILQLG